MKHFKSMPVIYQEDRERYEIDACLPQKSAVLSGKIDLFALTHGDYPGKPLPKTLIPEVSGIGFLDAIGEQDWGMDSHRNEGIEICLQESGENLLIVDGKKYPMPANTLSITRPWQLHRVGDPYLGPGGLHWIILDVRVRRPNQQWRWPDWCLLTEKDLNELTRLLRGNEHPVWRADSELVATFRRLATYVTADIPEKHGSSIMIAINQLLVSLLNLLRSQHIEPDEQFSSVVRTVELFLNELGKSPEMLGMPWTLEGMAAQCGLGRSAFSKYCYQLQNLSPIDFLNHSRLVHAANRLKADSANTVTEIAFDLGFSSSQYFARSFKRHFGCSPSAWRAKFL